MANFIYLVNPVHEIEKNDVGKLLSDDGHLISVHFIRLNKKLLLNRSHVNQINLEQIGDEYERKICDRCFKCLKVENFSNNRLKKDNKMTKRPSCKDCRKIIDGKSISAVIKSEWELKRPKNDLFKCPICTKITIAGLSKIVIDHDHKSGEVRGFICESCNTGIGRFKDNIEILQNAIEWLKKIK